MKKGYSQSIKRSKADENRWKRREREKVRDKISCEKSMALLNKMFKFVAGVRI